MCLKELTRCFGSPDFESDLRSPDHRQEQNEKHHDGARSNPKLPKTSDIPSKPREFGDSNGRVASYSPPEVTEGKHESPKRAPLVSTLAEKGYSSGPPKVTNRGVDPCEVPSRSPVKTVNATRDRLVSKYEPANIPKETKAPAEVGHKDISFNGDSTAKGQTEAKGSYGGSDETVGTKIMVKDPF